MRKSFIALAAAAAVGLGSLFGGFTIQTEASTKVESLKEKKNQVHNQRSNVQTNINKADQQIGNLQNKQADVEKEIERIGLAIVSTNRKITEKTNKINDTKVEIQKLQADIVVIKERIKKRNEMLKDRARNYQENGGMVNYLDVLMGSQSFNDFVDRANAVATIMEADQDILKQAEADKAELEQKQKKVENDLANLQSMLSELTSMKLKLNGQVAEQKKLMATLQTKEHEVSEQKMALQEENDLLAAQEVAIQQAIKLEQQRAAQRAAELERQRKEAARRAAAAAAAAQNSGGNSSSQPSEPSYEAPTSSGDWIKPTIGRVSSGFGSRWGEFHYGVDFANSGSNVPIFAAADGVVIRSYLSSSYGNCIFIAHSINGEVYTTVYAHMRVRLVQGGAVSKGQQIGIMGSTGESTGQHLHFELHHGSWNQAKSNAVNPAAYIPM